MKATLLALLALSAYASACATIMTVIVTTVTESLTTVPPKLCAIILAVKSRRMTRSMAQAPHTMSAKRRHLAAPLVSRTATGEKNASKQVQQGLILAVDRRFHKCIYSRDCFMGGGEVESLYGVPIS
ncbi:hypothetical protein M3J07_010690 [Ascochyta lentis]